MKTSLIAAIMLAVTVFAGCNTYKIAEDYENYYEENETMVDVWSIENETEFVIELYGQLCEKSAYGDEMDRLSEAERVVYIICALEEAINSEGFDGYFFNSSGNFANEIEGACRSIGADNMADICKKALDAYGGQLPEEWTERQERMEELESDEISDILSDCDSEFYEYPDDLGGLLYKYAVENKDKFE